MTATRKSPRRKNQEKTDPLPPGATQAASDHDLRPGEPAERTPAGEEAVGTPGGGTEVGGLAGTNVDDGDPENANLDKAMGSNARGEDEEEGGPPYAGHSGGATGGAIAQGRSSGGHQRHGLAAGGVSHGDSTIGREPTSRKKRKK